MRQITILYKCDNTYQYHVIERNDKTKEKDAEKKGCDNRAKARVSYNPRNKVKKCKHVRGYICKKSVSIYQV